MYVLTKLKKNKSCSDLDTVRLSMNFLEEWRKYPLSIFYTFQRTYTKKERLQRIQHFLNSTRKN